MMFIFVFYALKLMLDFVNESKIKFLIKNNNKCILQKHLLEGPTYKSITLAEKYLGAVDAHGNLA